MENVEYGLYSKEYHRNTEGIPRNVKEYLSKRQRVLHDVRQSISQIELRRIDLLSNEIRESKWP